MGLKRFFQQVWREAHLAPAKPTDVLTMVKDIDGMGFKLKCLLATGSYRFKPSNMKDEQVKEIADSVGPETVNFITMLRSAEDVLTRHGLIPEYLARVAESQKNAADAMKAKMMGLYDIVQRKIHEEGLKAERERAGMDPPERPEVGIRRIMKEGQEAEAMAGTLGDAESDPKVN